MRLRGVAVRLHGPLQAWGAAVVGDNRPTLAFPTRSGVLGLLAWCLGIRRHEVERLVDLARDARVHIRVDAPGTPVVDDQTIQDNPNASPTRQTIQSKRTYLCDASFAAVVVPGERFTPAELATALAAPVFSPYLGRRACVPSAPLLLAEEVSGDEPLELFAALPRGPTELLEALGDGPSTDVDFYLDALDHPRRLRRLPLRDDLAGPLSRQWRERFAVHVRVTGRAAPSFDAVEQWMPA